MTASKLGQALVKQMALRLVELMEHQYQNIQHKLTAILGPRDRFCCYNPDKPPKSAFLVVG